jgi:hypothetical protein
MTTSTASRPSRTDWSIGLSGLCLSIGPVNGPVVEFDLEPADAIRIIGKLAEGLHEAGLTAGSASAELGQLGGDHA